MKYGKRRRSLRVRRGLGLLKPWARLAVNSVGKYFEDLAVSELVRIGTNSSTFLPYGAAACGSKEEHQYISNTCFGIALVQSSNDNQTRKEGSLD